MKKQTFTAFRAADYLKNEGDIGAYLAAASEDEDPRVLVVAMGDVIRARNVSKIARDAGLTREGVYKAFSAEGNPSFATVMKVAKALDLEFCFAIVVLEQGRERRMNLRGNSAEARFAHLRDAITRWEDEWAAHHLRTSPGTVRVMRQIREIHQDDDDQKRVSGGKQTATKMKEKAAANRKAVLDAHRAGYPPHIRPRDRVGYLARKTKLSQPTVRKYLVDSAGRKSGSTSSE